MKKGYLLIIFLVLISCTKKEDLGTNNKSDTSKDRSITSSDVTNNNSNNSDNNSNTKTSEEEINTISPTVVPSIVVIQVDPSTLSPNDSNVIIRKNQSK